ncbi:hypothetical protein B0E38_01851 [Streptomyces sp. 111WW2]|uniref:hypothetical protein n=1 Tax=Streptomyces sp. 111WW2 TaxID=1945515 RepID=UPI000D0C7BE0|nr:hypothetical protein [Streptomyces sp. 111WW2]PSK58006.1 hypothetical protein B0E38_01851 [Streptomyces sp. 111WW2]
MSPSGASQPRPSVGRAVHYVSHGTPVREDGSRAYTSVCRAATVTEVDPQDSDRVGLAVHNPGGTFFHPLAAGGCTHAAVDGEQPPAGGTWHWPEVV